MKRRMVRSGKWKGAEERGKSASATILENYSTRLEGLWLGNDIEHTDNIHSQNFHSLRKCWFASCTSRRGPKIVCHVRNDRRSVQERSLRVSVIVCMGLPQEDITPVRLCFTKRAHDLVWVQRFYSTLNSQPTWLRFRTSAVVVPTTLSRDRERKREKEGEREGRGKRKGLSHLEKYLIFDHVFFTNYIRPEFRPSG